MTDAERRYVTAAAALWTEKIRHYADAHHVTVRMEALACLHAALSELNETDGPFASLVLDAVNAITTSWPERSVS